MNDRLQRTLTLTDVTLKTSNESDIGRCIDEDLQIHEFAHRRIREDQDTLDENDATRGDQDGFSAADMVGKVIDRHFDRLTSTQRLQVIDKEAVVEGVRVIEVDLMTQFQRHVDQVPVVTVLLQECDIAFAHLVDDFFCNGCFSGAATPRNTNDHYRPP